MFHERASLVSLALPLLIGGSAGAQSLITGRVTAVADGDTVTVRSEGKDIRVRLYAVDAPEAAQAWGDQARQFTASRVLEKTVRVEVKNTDEHGRSVGAVFAPDGANLNPGLVKAGLAWWYHHHGPKETALAQSETAARAARAGLWKDDYPVPPWAFRRPEGASGAAVASAAPGSDPRRAGILGRPGGTSSIMEIPEAEGPPLTGAAAPRSGAPAVRIVSLLPNPSGPDEGREQVTLLNRGAGAVDLTGWVLRDRQAGTMPLSGSIAPGARRTVTLTEPIALGNNGDEVTLVGPDGKAVQTVRYTAAEAGSGRVIEVR